MNFPTPTPSPTASAQPWISGTLTWDNGGATLGAAVVAALVVVAGYFIQQRISRQTRRAEIYGEALRVIHDYLEAPYRIRRRDGSARVRVEVTDQIGEIQSRLAYYQTVLRLRSPGKVSRAYDVLVDTAKSEAGAQMTAAWKARPTRRDSQVPLGREYPQPESDRALRDVMNVMGKLGRKT